MKKRPTVADVANLAGVSTMTVSRVMNQFPGVSEEKRQRIKLIADQIGFHPSWIARSLATRRSATIGLMMPDVSNPFFSQIARGAEDSAFENGYGLFLINTAESAEREKSALDTLWQHEIDGAILSSPRLPMETLVPFMKRFPAVVLVNRELENPIPGICTINIDDQRGAYLAVQKLISLKRSRVGYLAGLSTSISNHRRWEGYRQALEEAGIKYDPSLVEPCKMMTAGGYEAAQRLFNRCSDVDALFCFNDSIAVGAMQACLEAGITIPNDISVIGVDDIPLASMVTPHLSSLHIDLNWIGCQAMTMLLNLIHNPNVILEPMVIQPELILRQSAQ